MDKAWWDRYLDEVRGVFRGHLASASMDVSGVAGYPSPFGNSGAMAIALAAQFGASRIILLGYDCSTKAGSHWHGDHPKGLGNAGSVDKWPAQFRELRVAADVVNCSRQTALTAFRRGDLDVELKDKPALVVDGMHGLGDNLHQRSVMRELVRDHEVWLETPWPCLYHDLPVHVVCKGSRLRTQAKNARRESGRFEGQAPRHAKRMTVAYPPDLVRRHGSVLAAMSAQCGVEAGDFSLPVPDDWAARADALIKSWGASKPIMIYRPLVERAEWGGCRARNPDPDAYRKLFIAIRDRFFVVSVADLEDRKEWMVGKPVDADIEYHKGELDIEVLTGLVARAGLVFTSPGFAVILAQAVGTPSVAVFGGYENSTSFSGGAHLAPYLGIDPINPCDCFSHRHSCRKAIDVVAASAKLLEFVDEHTAKPRVGSNRAA